MAAKRSSTQAGSIEPGIPIKTNYASNPVAIPHDFLTSTPSDAQPVVFTPIDFSTTVLPQYSGAYAVIIDNVLSPSECSQLLHLAEASVPPIERGERDAWQPALVNIGGGYEILEPDYRNSDRIIWDCQEVVNRLWDRCLAAPGLKDRLSVVENDVHILGPNRKGKPQRWDIRRLNDRMRFLRYGSGQFFRPHTDGEYREPGEKIINTLLTLHLYMNDSKQTVGDQAELVGGATSFLSADGSRKMDVDPKAGRVLIFQHRSLNHSGDDVLAGTKYTMRTDIMYEMVVPEE